MTTLNEKQEEFRKALKKIMPGYKWTVHEGRVYSKIKRTFIDATGIHIQSAGFKRLSTLQVRRAESGEDVKYIVKSSGAGAKAPWLHIAEAPTLARALRKLQDHYEKQAYLYMSAAEHLHNGRRAVKT